MDTPLRLVGVHPGCHGPGMGAAACAPTPPMAPPPRRTCMGWRVPGAKDSDTKPPRTGAPGAAGATSSRDARPSSAGRRRPGVRSRSVLPAAARNESSALDMAPSGPSRDLGGGTEEEAPRRVLSPPLFARPPRLDPSRRGCWPNCCCSRLRSSARPRRGSSCRRGAGDGDRSASWRSVARAPDTTSMLPLLLLSLCRCLRGDAGALRAGGAPWLWRAEFMTRCSNSSRHARPS